MEEIPAEFRKDFLDEATELLSTSEECFLNLEKAKDDPRIVEKIFRLAHSLKGSAAAVGFLELGQFTHLFESLLLKIKAKEIDIDESIVSLLLLCNDYLTNAVTRLKKDPNSTYDNPELVDQVKVALTKNHVTVAPVKKEIQGVPESHAGEIIFTEHARFFDENANAPHVETNSLQVETNPNSQKLPQTKNMTEESIRVGLGRIDKLLNNVGELVILQTVLSQHKETIDSLLLQKTIGQMEKTIKEIQYMSMNLRMIPLKPTFQKLARIVRDTSLNLHKDIQFLSTGDETELDKIVLEKLGDPLVHLIRNAVDHGIEGPAARKEKGKDPQGTILLKAYHKGSNVIIEVQDDGPGLDKKKIIERAIEKKLLKSSENVGEEQILDFIFASGFSTKREVTDLSGRGVGLDVVKTNIKELQGEIEVESYEGQGTCFRIILPLTLAIVEGMVIGINNEKYIVPITQVYESLQPKKEQLTFVAEKGEMLNLRSEALPVYRLYRLLDKTLPPEVKQRPAWECIAIVVRNLKHPPFAILVDDILGQQQVVIKHVGDELVGWPGISGAAILGDGKVALILDFNELILNKHTLH